MYLPVMSSFLWPYCCCIHRLSIQTVTVNIPQPRQEDILPDHHDFVSFSFTYSYFPFLHSLLQFPFYIHHMPSNQISFLPYRPFKVPAFPEQRASSVTIHSITHKDTTFSNASKDNGFLKKITINIHVTSIHYALRNHCFSHLEQILKIKHISK